MYIRDYLEVSLCLLLSLLQWPSSNSVFSDSVFLHPSCFQIYANLSQSSGRYCFRVQLKTTVSMPFQNLIKYFKSTSIFPYFYLVNDPLFKLINNQYYNYLKTYINGTMLDAVADTERNKTKAQPSGTLQPHRRQVMWRLITFKLVFGG